MSKDNGTVTVGSLAAIVEAGVFLDKNIDLSNETGLKQTLIDVINDKDKLHAMWRALKAFPYAASELRTAEVGLGGKRAR